MAKVIAVDGVPVSHLGRVGDIYAQRNRGKVCFAMLLERYIPEDNKQHQWIAAIGDSESVPSHNGSIDLPYYIGVGYELVHRSASGTCFCPDDLSHELKAFTLKALDIPRIRERLAKGEPSKVTVVQDAPRWQRGQVLNRGSEFFMLVSHVPVRERPTQWDVFDGTYLRPLDVDFAVKHLGFRIVYQYGSEDGPKSALDMSDDLGQAVRAFLNKCNESGKFCRELQSVLDSHVTEAPPAAPVAPPFQCAYEIPLAVENLLGSQVRCEADNDHRLYIFCDATPAQLAEIDAALRPRARATWRWSLHTMNMYAFRQFALAVSDLIRSPAYQNLVQRRRVVAMATQMEKDGHSPWEVRAWLSAMASLFDEKPYNDPVRIDGIMLADKVLRALIQALRARRNGQTLPFPADQERALASVMAWQDVDAGDPAARLMRRFLRVYARG